MKYNILGYDVTGISSDTRDLKSTEAFFVISGNQVTDDEIIKKAIEKNPVVIFTENSIYTDIKNNICYVRNIKSHFMAAVNKIYHLVPDNLIAITGTNGKSSVTYYIYQLLSQIGVPIAAIGTFGLYANNDILTEAKKLFTKTHTTPSYLSLRKILHYLAQKNIHNVVLEASSHGLDQGRLKNLRFNFAAFTSFSQDHLDYHGSIENYLRAKISLFDYHLTDKAFVVLTQDIYDLDLVKNSLSRNHIIYSICEQQFFIYKTRCNIHQQEIYFIYKGKNYFFRTNILGSFQIKNILIAIELIIKMGYKMSQIISYCNNLLSVPGRLARISNINSKYHIFVDFAHTPDALKKLLEEFTKIKQRRLIILFGCGGNRDVTKRVLMGNIATDIADLVIVTDDNPRYENPQDIRKQIMEKADLEKIKEIGDRKEAIRYAVSNLKQNDILIIAGKGDENYQIVYDNKILFSDIQIAREAYLENELHMV